MKTPITFLVFFLFQNMLIAQQPLVAISDQMNVIYIGIDNPVTIAVEGFPKEHVYVSSDDLQVIQNEDGTYNLNPTELGTAILKVQPRGKATQEIPYRVKRIPHPVSKLGFNDGGNITLEYLKNQKGVDANIWPFELAECTVTSYEITLQSKNKDPWSVVNQGEAFSESAKKLINKVQSGDIVYFDVIKSICSDDPEERKMNSMIFKIK